MPRWIDDAETLARALTPFFSAPLVAVDCESDAMHAYRAHVCVVQLAIASPDAPAEEVLLVDTLHLGVRGPLRALLSADGPPKVLHDLGYDARILADEGVTLGRCDDTSVMARLLGEPATGLATLLSTRFGVSLDKRFQHHDWARRPVSPPALEYLAGDVAHLGRLHEALRLEAQLAEITDEIETDTAWSLRRALDDAFDPARLARPPFARIKGYRELSGSARAVLREVAAAREALAEERNVPIGRILPNAMALAVARAKPTTHAALLEVAGKAHANAPWSRVWLDAVRRGLAAPPLDEETRRLFAREPDAPDRAARRAREQRLSQWRRAESERRGVQLQVVLPAHCIEALAAMAPTSVEALDGVEGLGSARRRRYGDAIIEALTAPPSAPE